jgi:uncharacterized membrane protein HdeD (DUF308 family)
MMKTVGNDLIRNQLHADRKWYLLLGVLLVIFGLVLLAALPFATLSAVLLFGVLMMLGGILHFVAAFMVFKGAHVGCGPCLVCCIWQLVTLLLPHL